MTLSPQWSGLCVVLCWAGCASSPPSSPAGTGGTTGPTDTATPTGSGGGMVGGSGGSVDLAGASGGQPGPTGSGGAGGTGGASTASDVATDSAVTCPTANEEKFSFFLVSNAALIREGGADSTGMYPAYGGDLGGITGADGICQRVAQRASPCQSRKVWHAFLSTTTVNAIDRIGSGPWYDRNGRLIAMTIANLITDRPTGADPAIRNDLPNEDGFPNHRPNGTTVVDNHEVLTGSGADGKVYTQASTPGGGGGSTSCGPDVGATMRAWSAERATCWNWTRKTAEGCPRVGHPWCSTASCTPPGSGSGTNWMSVWNEGGCLPGGNFNAGGLDGTRKVGSAGGYGGFYCFAVR